MLVYLWRNYNSKQRNINEVGKEERQERLWFDWSHISIKVKEKGIYDKNGKVEISFISRDEKADYSKEYAGK